MSQDPQLISYLMLLRFGSCKARKKQSPKLGISSIAKMTRISPESVRRLIQIGLAQQQRKEGIKVLARTKLSEEHIQFLSDDHTLNAWAHLSLAQRAVLFHRQFPELRVSPSLLHRTYQRLGIKFKQIRRGKKVIDFLDPHYLHLFTDMLRTIRSTRHRDVKLFWVDEAVFTFNTIRKRAWSKRHQNITINDADYHVKAQALLCAVSDDGGLEAYQIHEKAVTSADFLSFVHLLAERAGGREFAIFMDNLRVHKTQEVTAACQRLRATTIYNVPYSPDFNGIEAYFARVKAEYKKLILQKLVKGIRPDVVAAIHQSIANVQKEKVQACVAHGLASIGRKAKELGLE